MINAKEGNPILYQNENGKIDMNGLKPDEYDFEESSQGQWLDEATGFSSDEDYVEDYAGVPVTKNSKVTPGKEANYYKSKVIILDISENFCATKKLYAFIRDRTQYH